MGDSSVQPYSELRPEIRVDFAGGHCGLRDIWSHALECKQTEMDRENFDAHIIFFSWKKSLFDIWILLKTRR